MEADLQMVFRLNGSNLRDTGHSFEAGPMAALAEVLPVAAGMRPEVGQYS